MKKELILVSFIFIGSILVNAQQIGTVGINTTEPKATLDVQAMSYNTTTPEGIIAPRLSLKQLIAKNGQYGDDQKGAIVYVTDITGTAANETANITSTGYYYFDGTIWQSICGKVSIPSEPWLVQGSMVEATSNNQNIYQTGKVAIGLNNAGDNQLAVKGASTLEGETRIGSTSDMPSRVTITQDGKVGVGTDAPSAKLSVIGNSTTSPIINIKDESLNSYLGKVLTSDSQGNGKWEQPGSSIAIMGGYEQTQTTESDRGKYFSNFTQRGTGQVNTTVLTAYTGMYIDLPLGDFQVNFSLWLSLEYPTATNNQRFASAFFSMSDTADGYINVSKGETPLDITPTYSTDIRSALIGPTYISGSSDFAGSGAIPISVTQDNIDKFKRVVSGGDANTLSDLRVRFYLWAYVSPFGVTFSGNNVVGRLSSRSQSPGFFGPYTQLYALGFSVGGHSDSVVIP